MGIRDALSAFVDGLRKGPMIPAAASSPVIAVNNTPRMIPATPGLGQVEVANTLELPTSSNVPTRWAHTFLGPGQPFAGQIDSTTRDRDAEMEPRSMQYVANINSTITPRISWGLLPFADLRMYAEGVPEVAGAVRLLTEEMKSFIPSLVDKDDNDIDVPELQWMIERPDLVNPWPVWLSRFLYNTLVYDAPAVYKMRDSTYLPYTRSERLGALQKGAIPRVELVTSAPVLDGTDASAHLAWTCPTCGAVNQHFLDKLSYTAAVQCQTCGVHADRATRSIIKGEDAGYEYIPFGSPIKGLRIIDGSTLFALIDERGEQPVPPAPAFTQVIWGVPRMFLNRNQVWYRPRFLRADSPYGRSFIEDALPAVKLLGKLWEYEKDKYESGNLPEMGMECPPSWTSADQILDYEDAYNARMAGNTVEKAGRMRFFPNGMRAIVTKQVDFNKEGYDAAVNTIRMAAGIPKSETGETPGAGLGGAGFQEAMESSFYRMGIAPLQTFIEGLFTDIIKENGYIGVKYKMRFPNESMDPEKEETKWQGRFMSGITTRDETRGGIGIDPIGGDEGKFLNSPGGQQPGEDPNNPAGNPAQGSTMPVGARNAAKHISVLKHPVAVLQHPVSVKKSLCPDWCDQEEFAIGMQEEAEHDDVTGGDAETRAQIVLAHLKETPNYYSRLIAAGLVEKDEGVTAQNAPNGVYLVDSEDKSESEKESVVDPDGLAKFANILLKHCGVCVEDDQYFGSAIAAPVAALMPRQGANVSQIVSIGGKHLEPRPAVFKPKSGEKPSLVAWAGGDLYRRAEAVYLVDRELAPDEDHYLVPVTWSDEIGGQPGSVQHYVNGGRRKGAPEYDSEYIEQAAVLDYITGQRDRANKNYLTHPEDERRPVLIDNDISFSPLKDEKARSTFVTALQGVELSESIAERIALIDANEDLWSDLADCLGDDEAVERARERVGILMQHGEIPPDEVGDGAPQDGGQITSDPATTAAPGELHKDAQWDETQHPRANNGQFSAAPGGGGALPQPPPPAHSARQNPYSTPLRTVHQTPSDWGSLEASIPAAELGNGRPHLFEGPNDMRYHVMHGQSGAHYVVAETPAGNWSYYAKAPNGRQFHLIASGNGALPDEFGTSQPNPPLSRRSAAMRADMRLAQPQQVAQQQPQQIAQQQPQQVRGEPQGLPRFHTERGLAWNNENHQRARDLVNASLSGAEPPRRMWRNTVIHQGDHNNEIRMFLHQGNWRGGYIEDGHRVGEIVSGSSPTEILNNLRMHISGTTSNQGQHVQPQPQPQPQVQTPHQGGNPHGEPVPEAAVVPFPTRGTTKAQAESWIMSSNYADVDWAWAHMGGSGDALIAMHDAYNIHHADTRLSTSSPVLTGSGSAIVIQGNIHNDATGNDVGLFKRTFTVSNGKKYVTHDYFRIDGQEEGGGFGSAFVEQSEQMYREQGIHHINVHANIDVGGYTWGRMGFDFSERWDRSHYGSADPRNIAISVINHHENMGRLTPENAETARTFVKNCHAWELCVYKLGIGDESNGKLPNSRKPDPNKMNFGKKVMLGSHWNGQKLMDVNSRHSKVGQAYYDSKRAERAARAAPAAP